MIVNRFVMDPKLMDENLIDRLHQPLTKTIPHYLDKLCSIDQSINDMQHITESYTGIYIYINNFNTKCNKLCFCLFVLMVFNINNISALSWQSVLLMEETGGPIENHWPVTCHWQTLSHNVDTLPWSRFELTTSVVIGNDCIGSCKSYYHMI